MNAWRLIPAYIPYPFILQRGGRDFSCSASWKYTPGSPEFPEEPFTLSGAFAAQYLGFADVGLGQGIIISGLASVMIGEFLILRSNRISVLTLGALLGSICFHGVLYVGRYYGYLVNMTPNDLNLIKGILIIVLLVVTQGKNLKRRAARGVAQHD